MNILMVTTDWFPTVGGVPLTVIEIGNKLEERGHNISYLVASRKDLDTKGKKVYVCRNIIKLLNRNQICIGVKKILIKIINEENIDIIILNSYMFELNSRILFWVRLLNIKIPVILYYLGSLEPDVKRYLSFSTRIGKEVYDFTIARFLFKKSDKIFSNSEPTISQIKNKYKINKENIIYMPNGIEKKHFILRNQINKSIIFNGRLTVNKGIFLLPKIINSIPEDWSLTIIGDGPEKKTIEDLMKKKRNILWLKNIPHDKVFEYLSQSDILILPSYAEGSPRVCLEASVCGVPSIVFDVGDVKNIVLKPDIFVVPKFYEDMFIEKLNFLIKNYSSFKFDTDIEKIQNSYELDLIIDLFEKNLFQLKSINNG